MGEITPNTRAVAVRINEDSVNVRFYFDSEVDEEDVERVSVIESEVIADFPDHIIHIDYVHQPIEEALAYWGE